MTLALLLFTAATAGVMLSVRARRPNPGMLAFQRCLCELPAFCITFLIFVLLLAGLGASWLLTLPQSAAAVIERLRPLLIWALLVSGQALLFQARFVLTGVLQLIEQRTG